MTEIALSKNNIPIRLTDERWKHIVQEHGELFFFKQAVLDALSEPHRIVAGSEGDFIALREIETNRWLVVIYKEEKRDGFVVTAFVTRRKEWWERRKLIWP